MRKSNPQENDATSFILGYDGHEATSPMRTIHKLQDLRIGLYRQRVSRRRYLVDVPYENLCSEERERITLDARRLKPPRNLDLRLVWVEGALEWHHFEIQ